jgi:hypothetical protein
MKTPLLLNGNAGFFFFLDSKNNREIPEFLSVCYIVRFEYFIAGYFKYDNAMKIYMEIVSFTCTSAMIRCHLKNFLEGKPNGIPFCCHVKCLSTSSV